MEGALPYLASLNVMPVKQPRVTITHGVQAMKQVYREIFSRPFIGMFNPERMYAQFPNGTVQAAFGRPMRVVRVMPNTPALVLAGAAGLCAGSRATPEDLHVARTLFDALGKTVVVSEALMDAVTGLSGSGPAYIFVLIEALADGGVKMGLAREAALTLAAQTVYGSAKLLLETGLHPAELKDRVASPAGTTIAGLHALEEHAFRGAIIDAVERATLRSRELGR